jgi:hypothetical protein
MGYRSEIAIAVEKEYQQTFLDKLSTEGLTLINDMTLTSFKDHVIYSLKDWKWYIDCPGYEAEANLEQTILDIIKDFGEKLAPVEFLRLGEELGDIDFYYSNNWGERFLSYTSPKISFNYAQAVYYKYDKENDEIIRVDKNKLVSTKNIEELVFSVVKLISLDKLLEDCLSFTNSTQEELFSGKTVKEIKEIEEIEEIKQVEKIDQIKTKEVKEVKQIRPFSFYLIFLNSIEENLGVEQFIKVKNAFVNKKEKEKIGQLVFEQLKNIFSKEI